MPNLQLDWRQSTLLTVVLLAAALAFARTTRLRPVVPFAREAALIGALYSLWIFVGTVAETHTAGAASRARWIERVERDWHLPGERGLEDALVHHSLLAQTSDIYYATMHFTGLFLFLLWLFVRHRDRYGPVRTDLAVVTFLSLLIQFVPVAPPRLMPGYLDIAASYGQSVYAIGVVSADQLSAMPSVHVAWAVLIGVAVVGISTSPWRWVALLHPLITVYVVVATGNHWWADGIVSVGLLAVVAAVHRAALRQHKAARVEHPVLVGGTV